jgi:hypothetical protein
VKTALLDAGEQVAGQLEISGRCAGQQSAQIVGILGAAAVVTRQDLHRDQMREAGHRHLQAAHDRQALGGGHDLGLDARRGEEEVDDDGASVLTGAGRSEPHGGHAPTGGVLEHRGHSVAAPLQCEDHRLGVGVVADSEA